MKTGIPRKLARLGHSLREMPPQPKLPPCVYFLLHGRSVRYVGRTTNLWARVAAHRQSSRFKFNLVLYVPVPKSELKWVERQFINELRTPHNGGCRSRAVYEERRKRAVLEGRCEFCDALPNEAHEEFCEEKGRQP